MTAHAEIRTRLTQRLEGLERRVDRIGGDRSSTPEKDWQEQAVQRENDEVLDALDEAGRQELEEIRAALGRMDADTFGTCIGCGEEIPAARLEALPTATHCVGCAERLASASGS